MDELDAAIVAHLQHDGRLSNRDLAGTLGIAASTCLERTKALRARGIITGFRAEVSLPKVGRQVQALLHVQVRPLSREVIQGFKNYVVALPEVLSVFVVAGGDDFLVHVATPSIDDLHALLMDELSKRKEVTSFRSSIVYEHTDKRIVEVLSPARGNT